MKVSLNIDLRKSDPLGLDLDCAWEFAKHRYQQAQDMGDPDRSRPGYTEHLNARHDLVRQARHVHTLLVTVARMVGPEVWSKIPALSWAMNHDWAGVKMATPRC